MRTQINDLEKFIEFLKGKQKQKLFENSYFNHLADSANAAAAAASDKKSIEPSKSSPNKSNPVRFIDLFLPFIFSKYSFSDNNESPKNAFNFK